MGQYMSQIEIEDLQIDFLITVQGYEYIILKMNLEAKKNHLDCLLKVPKSPETDLQDLGHLNKYSWML